LAGPDIWNLRNLGLGFKTLVSMTREKKIRRHEPIQAIIHINMEVPQGNSLCRYFKQVKMSFFCFTKSENRRVK
jgi:hypothetical protein